MIKEKELKIQCFQPGDLLFVLRNRDMFPKD